MRALSGVGGLRAAAALAALAALAGVAGSAAAAPDSYQVLSRPGHGSEWSFVEVPTVARSRPAASAPPVQALALTTQDGTSELVFDQARRLVLGRWWVLVRLPSRPAGEVGWVTQSSLGAYQTVDTLLVVSTERLTAILYRSGKVIFRARVGVGKASTPTPHGRFYIRDRLTGFPAGSLYGPLAFGTSALSNVETDWPRGGVIGIHGTDQPWLIPGYPSHGCIRMHNADILRLGRLMPVGTPLTID
jgi:lipoprotein-anchoring transpeptidase ErfK/SrfK